MKSQQAIDCRVLKLAIDNCTRKANTMSLVRIIVEPQPKSGIWNMAVDESLLLSACEENICTIRWYRWREATLSLGYFQKAANRAKQARQQIHALVATRRSKSIPGREEWPRLPKAGA